MARQNLKQPDVPPFEYRSGVTMPVIGGMYRRGDPAQIPAHRLHLGVNSRFEEDSVIERPGLTPVEGVADGACITGIFETDERGVGLYITECALGLLVAGVPTPSDNLVMRFNEEATPVELNFWSGAGGIGKSTPSPWRKASGNPPAWGAPDACFNSLQRMNGKTIAINGPTVYEVTFAEEDGAGRVDITKLFEIPASAGVNVTSTCTRRERVDDAQTGGQFDRDVLYMGCEEGEVWRWDGVTLDKMATVVDGGHMQVLNVGSAIVAVGDPIGGGVCQSQPGFPWDPFSISFDCHGMVEWRGKAIMVGDNGDDAFAGKFSPGDVSVATFVTGTFPGHDWRFRSPVVAAGNLYFLVNTAEHGAALSERTSSIAEYTSDLGVGSLTWVDIGSNPNGIPDPGFFISYRGSLLLFRTLLNPADQSSTTQQILEITPVSGGIDVVYEWPLISGEQQLQPGTAYEAIPLS